MANYESKHNGQTIDNGVDVAISSIAPEFSTSTPYTVGKIVRYGGLLYACIEDCEGTWVPAKWRQIVIVDQFESKLPDGTVGYYLKKTETGVEWAEVQGGSQLVLTEIVITKPPTKTSYYAGESFDNTGMEVTASYTLGGIPLTAVVTNYNITPTGGLAAGTTYVTVSLTEGQVTKEARQNITVTKAKVAVPTVTGSLTYNGSPQSPNISGFDSMVMNKSGSESETNAGTYTITFSLIDPSLYTWTDGTIANKSVTWSIGKKSLTKPTLSNTQFTYNGNEQGPTVTGFDSTYMSKSGTEKAINAATGPSASETTNTINVALKDKTNCEWSTGGTTDVSLTWKILRANPSAITVNPTSVTLNTETKSVGISVTRQGDGAITATSNATNVATVSVSGTTVTVASVNDTTGSATVTIKVAKGTNYNAPSDKTVAVTATFTIVAPSWSSGSYAEIETAINAYHSGGAVDFGNWNIGDQRNITIDGGTYKLTLAHKFTGTPTSSTAAYAFNGTAKYPAYAVVCIPQNGTSTYMSSNTAQKYFEGTLHTYCNNTQYTKIKNTDVGKLFKPFQCYVGKECTSSSTGNYGTYNQSITLASLAMKEVGLSSNNNDENNALIQFSYFSSAAQRKITGNSYYWLRSPRYRSSGNYYSWQVYSSDGSSNNSLVSNSYGVCWFGCI